MTTATMNLSIPCEVLGKDPAVFLQPGVGQAWPQEAREVTLHDLKPELENPETAQSPMEQLDSRGFAVVKNKSEAMGPLAQQREWNEAFLQAQLGAREVVIWNSVTRSSEPKVNTPYDKKPFAQDEPIEGLQFPDLVRPTASGAHVDQDALGSRRICKLALGEDVFEKYSRVQQINVWVPLKGPVTAFPLAVCDGSTFTKERTGYSYGMFASRINAFYGEEQKWYYIKRQEPDEYLLLKIYDSNTLPGHAEFTPHTGVDDLHGADGPETARESIEVRLVACY
ncbi:hypothetical protein BP6252_06003 [Coleophoma cylindrospora]|uniref:Methyltransferase n=1 Tax=Coleophoma cylindrospora TaxID=1849047 RepID=A0A3D8RM37_9HELO|nr:hypothetical protein BP6252_06003 [Coleophoma cylindrospora]